MHSIRQKLFRLDSVSMDYKDTNKTQKRRTYALTLLLTLITAVAVSAQKP